MKVNIIKTGVENIKEEIFVTDNNVLYECNATGTVIVPKDITIIGSNVFANKSLRKESKVVQTKKQY